MKQPDPLRVKPHIANWVSHDDLDAALVELSPWYPDSPLGRAIAALRHRAHSLITRRDRLDAVRQSIPRGGFGVAVPTEAQAREMYDASEDFFNAFYSTLDALLTLVVNLDGWAPLSVSKPKQTTFLDWLRTTARIPISKLTISELEAARAYRAKLNHANGSAYEFLVHEDHFGLLIVVLYGSRSSVGEVPNRATHNADLPGDWQLIPPSEVSVTNALVHTIMAVVDDYAEGRGPVPIEPIGA